MRIAFNPLFKDDNKTKVGALTSAPTGNDIVFDLPGKAIYTKQTKFKGTDHTYQITANSPLSAAATDKGDDTTSVSITLNLQDLKQLLLEQWDISKDFGSFHLYTNWHDSGINLSELAVGVYLLEINYEQVIYSGTFSLNTTCNTNDEIYLHQCGNVTLNRGRVYAKIEGNAQNKPLLMLAGQVEESNISKFLVRIKQIG